MPIRVIGDALVSLTNAFWPTAPSYYSLRGLVGALGSVVAEGERAEAPRTGADIDVRGFATIVPVRSPLHAPPSMFRTRR
jgi:hypothetical protein